MMRTSNFLWAVLAIAYLVVRFAFTQELDRFGVYASYILEVICVALAVVFAGRKMRSYFSLPHFALLAGFAGLVAGFAAFKLAGIMAIPIPFAFDAAETLFFLLIVAPILEEFVFRFFLWQPIEWTTRLRAAAWLGTSVAFAYSHFHAIWYLPPEYHLFVQYQTAYTFVLGLACGYFVYKHQSLLAALALHFMFNLGFYIGSLV